MEPHADMAVAAHIHSEFLYFMIDENKTVSFCGDQPAAAQDSHMADRRELALVAIERTRMPMVVSDPNQPDNPIVLANQAFLHLTGYSAEEVIGRNCRFLQGPSTAPSDIDFMREELSHDADHIELELLNYRKDGSTFWNQLGISAVRDSEGRLLYHFASQKDVTTCRRAQELEANEHRLLMEVDHRAMNALALVQGIVSLTRAENAEDQLQAIRRRVNSLARAHQLLARRRWRGVDIHALVQSQIGDKFDRRVTLRGEAVTLAPHIVQPLALVLQELFSNAEMHGALAGVEGEVQLSWRTLDTALQLVWVEEPVNIKEDSSLNTVGLEIVRNVVESQLVGQLTRENSDTTLTVELVVADVLEHI